MAAVAEGAIDGEVTGLRREHFEHLMNHDRAMHARRSPASGKNPGDVARINLGRMLFVFLGELPRVFSSVPLPTLRSVRTHIRPLCRSGSRCRRTSCSSLSPLEERAAHSSPAPAVLRMDS